MIRLGRLPRHGIWAAVAVCSFAAAREDVAAQALPRLHVTALGMHADRPVVAAGDTYHVTIHVHVRERLERLDELQLPALGNAIDRGDERRRVIGSNGTDFYETMTLASPQAGSASFTPAYLDAIDPVTNRGMRYSSAALTVRVTAASTGNAIAPAIGTALREVMLFALGSCAVALVLIALIVRYARRPRSRARRPVDVVQPSIITAAPVAADALAETIAAFRSRGDDAALDALRAVLFVRAGAAGGATLADALTALGTRDPALARAMAVAERVRFGPTAHRDEAARDLDAALDAFVRGAARV